MVKLDMGQSFIHLNVHTEYSIVDGLTRIKPLMQKTAESGMGAVALTDQSNLFAAVKWVKQASSLGVKPILGADVWLENEAAHQEPHHLILLCQSDEGYLNLRRLISRAYVEGQQQGKPIVHQAWLTPESVVGLIALSGAQEGDVGRALLSQHPEQADALLERWKHLFPNRYYLELQRLGQANEAMHIEATLALAQTHQLPVVATNAVRFLAKEDFDAHEARVCIHEGRQLGDATRPQHYTPYQYLRTPQEMLALFADIPSALTNTVEIAKRCNATVKLGETYLPNFPIPTKFTVESYLANEAKKGLEARLAMLFQVEGEDFAVKRKPYDERLQIELDVINNMGFPGYFLIVADFIHWAKQNNIPVGPGRGSGAGSLVAYALQITDLDPLAYDLLFERFLNPERVSMPDFDIDFCMDGRDRVIEYVAETYGCESVSQIITFGTMAAKAVVRDVGRVLGHNYGFVDKIAKLIPFELGMTLKKALEDEELLKERYDAEEEVKALIDLAFKLEGITRNAGKHAGGVVIAPSKLTDFSALYCEEDGSNLVTQFDKDDVEAAGLVKFDFLGLRTLTIIHWAVLNVQKSQDIQINIETIPLNDEKTFELLKACQTTAVFQLESRGMKELIKRLTPDCFEDIIALVALFRPGPLQSGMVDDFIDRKHGRAKVVYPHPDLESILKPTYGVILYQEQVMQIAQVLANFTLGAADLLRRAMGKKKPEEMAKQRDIFVKGALARDVDEETATYIFDLMEKFAGYGFNKSHSAAYALVSYQTAWLKAHYPAEFMAAVLSSDMDNTDKVINFVEECRHMGLAVVPPDINLGVYKFTVSKDGSIIYGLGAIKGVGESAIEALLAERNAAGVFKDLFDVCRRSDMRRINRRTLEALIKSGAMDKLGANRHDMFASIDKALKSAEQEARDNAAGQHSLFGHMEAGHDEGFSYISAVAWNEAERLAGEKSTLGMYLTGHPLDIYRDELKQFITCGISELNLSQSKTALLAGLVIALRFMTTKSNKRMAVLTLDDGSARLEVAIFSEVLDANREKLVKDTVLVIEGEVSVDDFSGGYRMLARQIDDMPEARCRYGKCLALTLHRAEMSLEWLDSLKAIFSEYPAADCPIAVEYICDAGQAHFVFDANWKRLPCDGILKDLKSFLGEENVRVHY